MKKQTTKVKSKPKTKALNKALVSYPFLPDSELLNFAKQFSDN